MNNYDLGQTLMCTDSFTSQYRIDTLERNTKLIHFSNNDDGLIYPVTYHGSITKWIIGTNLIQYPNYGKIGYRRVGSSFIYNDGNANTGLYEYSLVPALSFDACLRCFWIPLF